MILVRITSVDYHLEKQVLLVCEMVFIELFEGFSISELNFMHSLIKKISEWISSLPQGHIIDRL